MEDLFPPDVLQPRVQVPDLLHQRLDLVLVRALDPAGLANRHVQCELDCAVHAGAQPAATTARYILGCHADPMLAAVGSAESEAALGATSLGNNAVVVIECLFYGNEDADVGLGLVGFGCVVPCFGVVVAWPC